MTKQAKLISAGATLAVLILIIIIFTGGNEGEKAPGADSPLCQDLSAKISAEIDKMNYCRTAGGCVLLNECPDNCRRLINQNADMNAYLGLSREYREKCPPCAQECRGSYRSDQIACESGKCVAKD